MLLNKLISIIEDANKKLKKQEEAIFKGIKETITKAGKVIIDAIKKPFVDLKENSDLFPREKAIVLRDRVNIDIARRTQKTVESGFTKIVNMAKKIGTSTANAILKVLGLPVKPAARDTGKSPMIADSVNRFGQWSNKFNDSVVSTAEVANSSGWGVQKLAGAIKKQVGSLIGRVKQIASTVSVFVTNNTTKKIYRANGFDLVQWVATIDDRLCPYCATRHLNVYRITEVTIPLHVNCRCQTIPFKRQWLGDGTFSKAEIKAFQKQVKSENESLNYGASPFEDKPPDKQVDF